MNAIKKQSTRMGTDEHRQFLINEAEALLTRIQQVKPPKATMPMVAAASVEARAFSSIHHLIREVRLTLKQQVKDFIEEVKKASGASPNQLQKAYAQLKLRFNALLDSFDIFADVFNQRSEHDTGIWLAGLDALARDALQLEGKFYEAPPLMCYLDRGHGAAIRRARTRLPGDQPNPVAIIQVPRERMVGSGIGSSLIHEVGHQGSALLDLMASLPPVLEEMARKDPRRQTAWQLFRMWISEILSDMWAVGFLGVSATTGLMGVVSLPEYFVFRLPDGEPHPFPWIRVKISIAFGRAMYPDRQWNRLERLWEQLYPPKKQSAAILQCIEVLMFTLDDFVQLVLQHRPKALRGRSLKEAFPLASRQPGLLREYHRKWQQKPEWIYRVRPTMVFAVVGQARADQRISPAQENQMLTQVLFQWAIMQQQHLK